MSYLTNEDTKWILTNVNLCSVTKVFDKLILQRIGEIEEKGKVGIIGDNQIFFGPH